jgi:hypothetical protein
MFGFKAKLSQKSLDLVHTDYQDIKINPEWVPWPSYGLSCEG